MLFRRDGRPADGVAAESAPRRQALSVEQDVVVVPVPRDDDQHVVEHHSALQPSTQQVLVEATPVVGLFARCCC